MERVTLVMVETESYELARVAFLQSIAKYPFEERLVFTDCPEHFPEAQCVKIPKLQSISQYNNLMLKVVPEFIQTPFFLVIQFDGFILNESAFDPVFFDYDYIGAPWNGEPEQSCVGNGGFSWRSKRLADAVKERVSDSRFEEAEDVMIGQRLRYGLEKREGLKFAPRSVAARFSFEFPATDVPTFGFHGVFNLPLVYKNEIDWLVNHLPSRVLMEGAGFNLLILTFNALGIDPKQLMERARRVRCKGTFEAER